MKVVAQRTLWLIIAANVLAFLSQEGSGLPRSYRQPLFNIQDGSFLSIIASMFHHADAPHLVSNMLGLLNYGTYVFIETSSPTWQSPFTILSVYLGSGIGASYGLIGLSSLLERQWDSRLRSNRQSARNVCSQYWLCRNLGGGSWSQPLVDFYTHIVHADEISALSFYRIVPRIGASGAVFGVLGARLFTSFFSRYHSRLSQTEILYFFAIVAYEASLTPVQLKSLWDLFVMGDRIDHAGHFFGLLSGIILASFVQRIQSKWRQRDWGAAGGRRLGTR